MIAKRKDRLARCALIGLALMFVPACDPGQSHAQAVEAPSTPDPNSGARAVATTPALAPGTEAQLVILGAVYTETATRFAVQLQNTTEQPIEILSTNASCGCTDLQLDSRLIDQGQVATLSVVYTAPTAPKLATSDVAVALRSDGRIWDQTITLGAEVLPAFEFHATSGWTGSPRPLDIGSFAPASSVRVFVRHPERLADLASPWTSLRVFDIEGNAYPVETTDEGWAITLPSPTDHAAGSRVAELIAEASTADTLPLRTRRLIRYSFMGPFSPKPASLYLGSAPAGTDFRAVVRLDPNPDWNADPDHPQAQPDISASQNRLVTLESNPRASIQASWKPEGDSWVVTAAIPAPDKPGSHLDALLIRHEHGSARVPVRLTVLPE